jgi:hypothetical protein
MHKKLEILLSRLEKSSLESFNVIPWSSPVISFGNLATATVATLGINPSNREFVDLQGNELQGIFRRFHTLKSLGLNKWSEARPHHLELIVDSCQNYFQRNPYEKWFKGLDQLISGTETSFYSSSRTACHLDLIPYATEKKWTNLKLLEQSSLLNIVGDTLGQLVKDSSIRILVLNGASVVKNFEKLAPTKLEQQEIPLWELPRKTGIAIKGYSYFGRISKIAGIELSRQITILGYNHNLQSSFGVTNKVKSEIQKWIGIKANGFLSD